MHPEAVAQVIAALIAVAGTIFVARQRQRSDLLAFGHRVAIRTFDGRYLTSTEGQCRIVALNKHYAAIFRIANPREPFVTVHKGSIRYGSRIALFVVKDDQFVGADLNSGGDLWARVAWVKDWEFSPW